MKAEWRPDGLEVEAKRAYWKENVKLVERILGKYGCGHKES